MDMRISSSHHSFPIPLHWVVNRHFGDSPDSSCSSVVQVSSRPTPQRCWCSHVLWARHRSVNQERSSSKYLIMRKTMENGERRKKQMGRIWEEGAIIEKVGGRFLCLLPFISWAIQFEMDLKTCWLEKVERFYQEHLSSCTLVLLKYLEGQEMVLWNICTRNNQQMYTLHDPKK